MTALAKETPLPVMDIGLQDIPAAAVAVYGGAALGINSSGYGRGFVLGDRFAGHAIVGCDNSAGNAGDKRIHARTGRYRLQVTLTGVAITSRDKPVFIGDDGSYSLRAGTYVGKVKEYVTTDTAVVEFDTTRDLHCLSETLLFSAFTDGGSTSGYKDLATQLPANCLVLACEFNVVTGFTGDTTAVVKAGTSGSVAAFTADTAQSVLAAGLKGSAAPVATQYVGSATTVRVTVTGGADFTSVAAGEMDARVWYLPLN